MKNLISRGLGLYLNVGATVAPKRAARQGFNIFCYPFRAPLKPFHKQFLNSSHKSDFEHQGVQLQTYRWGSGARKVLFVHGWQSHSFRWKSYVEALPKEEFTIYALDAPGHGYSKGKFLTVPLYADLINRFVESIGGVETVVSHSIGGFSMLYALYQHPGLGVDKLVVMGSPANAGSFMRFYQQTLGLTDRTTALIVQHFEKAVGKPVPYFDAARFAQAVQVPGLIIHDKGDLEAPFSAGIAIHNAWKGSRLVATEGLGHKLKSPEVVAKVLDYIKSRDSNPVGQPVPAAALLK